jgi:heterodisulfide reductase subunit A
MFLTLNEQTHIYRYYCNDRKPFLKGTFSYLEPLRSGCITVRNKRKVLVIGAGIAGLQASLDLARAGLEVYLVERNPRIGGHVPLLHRVLPTLENAEELIKPLIEDVTKQDNIRIIPYCEIAKVERGENTFGVTILKKARYVDEEKCTLCGECEKVCPIDVPKEYEMNLSARKAVYLPSPCPIQQTYLIDKEHCLYFLDGSCHACRKACPEDAIVYGQKPEEERIDLDAIIVATGFKLYDVERKGQYKYGVYRNVITGMEYERLCSPDGPTNGKILRIDNLEKPKSVVYILCVGSREEDNNEYCCRIGCLNALKHAYLLKDQYKADADAHICYTDIRAVGKRGERFYRRVRESEVNLIHGEPSEIRELPDKSLTIDVYDQATSKLLSINADIIVLEAGLEPEIGLHRKLGVSLTPSGFFEESHPQLARNETAVKGVFLAGAVQEPMNIAETMTNASAAAMKALISLLE